MDMSFHLQQLGKASRMATANTALPGPMLSPRNRIAVGDDPMRALTHAQLMALVSNRTNRNRIRHWQSEALQRQKVGDGMAARVALFAGSRARFPAWARSAAGSFARPMLNTAVLLKENKVPAQNREDDVYLGALSNRKVLPVDKGLHETVLAPWPTPASHCDVEI